MSSDLPGFISRDKFEIILENAVIPTFDLILNVPEKGVLMARRKIAPYAGKWALPGLRMYKGETVSGTLSRIASTEVGISINPDDARLVGQFVGKFTTEHSRQDLSTCYAINTNAEDIEINQDHFTGHRFVQSVSEIPAGTGAMYRHYLSQYFEEPK